MTKDATCIQMRVEVRARQILQGTAGPRGEIQPQSLPYHYSKIGWRWRHGKYDSVSELMGTAQGECRIDDVCTRVSACCGRAGARLCVCVHCEINSHMWCHWFSSYLKKSSESMRVFVMSEQERRGPVIHLLSSFPLCLAKYCPAPPFETFLDTVLETYSGLKWLSSTSNFTARHTTQTIPLGSAWLDPFALDTSSAYWLMGLISESGGALRHQSLSSPYLFSEPVIPCYDSSRKASLDRGDWRERERGKGRKRKGMRRVEGQSVKK